MSDSENWYVVQQNDGRCQILTAQEIEANQANAKPSEEMEEMEQWGPFASEGEAIARRVGLIRAGKCKPA